MENLSLSPAQRGDINEIIAAIQRHVEGQINESVERRHFRQRKQQQGESFDGESFDDVLVSPGA